MSLNVETQLHDGGRRPSELEGVSGEGQTWHLASGCRHHPMGDREMLEGLQAGPLDGGTCDVLDNTEGSSVWGRELLAGLPSSASPGFALCWPALAPRKPRGPAS